MATRDTTPKAPKSAEEKGTAAQAKTAKKERFTPKRLDPHTYVRVINGYHGELIYISPRTGEKFGWPEFGADQYIELQDLRAARSSGRAFFEKNWFLIEDQEILEDLGVARFYKNAITAEEFDTLFDKEPNEVLDTVSKLSDGQKKAVGFLAKKLIAEQKLDSISLITSLEELLGTELIER